MRPLNISISAFGPYAEYTNIPMEELGDRGLYLITGDTGAGKTTIFDAICFALFGEPSGNTRDASMFRSKYAAPETPTEVELTFRHMGRIYRIKRNPEYMRPAKKGGGETKQLAKAELTMPDGSVITRVRTVTEKVEEILGINRDQFSQIAMLAQGDFLKLLLASTEDRIRIFRNLFKTGGYLTLQNEMDNSYKELYGKVQDGRKSIEQYVGGIQADRDNVLSIEADKARKGELVTEDVIALLERLIDYDRTLKQETDGLLKKTSKELEDINRKIGSAQALEKAKLSREQALKSLEVERPKEAVLNEKFQKAKESLGEKSVYEKKATTIENDFPKYGRSDELRREIKELKKSLEKQKEQIEKDKELRKKKSKQLQEFKEEQAAFKDTSAEIEKILGRIRKTDEELTDIGSLSRALVKFFSDRAEYEKKQEIYKAEDAEFMRLSTIYLEMDRKFRSAQAGILARNLSEGEECPVCGSVHHPKLAHLSDEVPSEKEVENAGKNSEKARNRRDKSAEELSGMRKGLETVEEELRKKCDRQLSISDPDKAADVIDERADEIKKENLSLRQRLKEEEERKKRGAELDRLIPGLEKEIESIDSGISQENTKLSGDTTKAQLSEKELKTLLESLKFETRDDAIKEQKMLLSKAKALQDAYDAADRTLNGQRNMITELETRVKEYEKNIRESALTDIENDREQQRSLKKKQDEYIRQGEIVAGRIDNNVRIKENIIKRSAALSEMEKKLQWLKTLSDTANGKLTGKDKVRLETYIQTTYFDRIIRHANLRLVTMSGGQYELVRLKEADNTKSQSGLDLGVIDHYNASQRSVRTLSGGESFMASLSLALGLSDEVQSSAGGIQIDTLFVDEGFGSLDSDALDMAYKALAGLIEGNRLVGIISHVDDLKMRIDRQIIVTKDKSGCSSVRIV